MGDNKDDDNKCSCDEHVYTIHPNAVDSFYAALDNPDDPTDALRKLFEKKTTPRIDEMKQKYAIVPLRDDGGFETAGGVFYPGKSGKVSKEQVEKMAKTFVETMWHSGTWGNAMTKSIESIGLDVEDEQ